MIVVASDLGLKIREAWHAAAAASVEDEAGAELETGAEVEGQDEERPNEEQRMTEESESESGAGFALGPFLVVLG